MDYSFILLKDMNKVTDQKLLVEYENRLYDAFVNNRWVMDNFEIINGCRMRPPVRYEDVIICCAMREGIIVSGLALHTNPDSLFQAEIMGFDIDKTAKRAAEGLSFFMSDKLGVDLFQIFDNFMEIVYNKLESISIEAIYTTGSKRLATFYKIFRFKQLQNIVVDGEEKFLLERSVP